MNLRLTTAALVTAVIAACAEKPAPAPAATASEATNTTASASAAPGQPSLAEAQKIVADSSEFREFLVHDSGTSVPLTLERASDEIKSVVEDLQRTGWVTSDGINVTLTEKAKNDKRFVVKENGSVSIGPLGENEMIAAKQVVPADNGQVRVFFDWKIVPNEIGKEIDLLSQMFIDENEAMARLIHDGKSWTVLRITPL